MFICNSFQSMMSGTIPGFVDVVLNFGSTVLKEDNLILQLKRINRKINFFGDDTWIKLFPNQFDRMDGTTSFFVADYTEVGGHTLLCCYRGLVVISPKEIKNRISPKKSLCKSF